MPLNQEGLLNYGSDIDRKVKEQIDKVFSMLDRHISRPLRQVSRISVKIFANDNSNRRM